MENIAFDIWLSGRLDFSDEDKRGAFETAREFVQVAIDVRKNGLLSIDDKISEYPDLLMRKALQLAVDSIEPEEIQKLLQTHIVANNYKGERLLQSILIRDGIILLVNGWNPKQVKEFLGVYFGDDFLQEYNDYIGGGNIDAVGAIINRPSDAGNRPPDADRDYNEPIAPRVRHAEDKLTQEEIDALIIKLLNGGI